MWSRNSKDLTDTFPDVQAALARQVTVHCVLDGELVVWRGERLDFDAYAFSYSGVGGLVVKGAGTRYQPGRRDWVKVNSVGVPRVRFAGASGVVPGRRVVWRGDVVRDGCRGRAATWSRSSLRGWLSFEFEFAWAVEAVLGERTWPGGSTYEPQWDGYLH